MNIESLYQSGMLRIFIDELGTGHNDLFLRIDGFPSYSKTADSYYLFDFLEIGETELKEKNIQHPLKYGASELINYWDKRIADTIQGHPIFLPFEFCDEYIGGLILNRTPEGFIIYESSTTLLHGWDIGKSFIDELIEERKIVFEKEKNSHEYSTSYKQLQEGFQWSLNKLQQI